MKAKVCDKLVALTFAVMSGGFEDQYAVAVEDKLDVRLRE